MGNKDDGCSRGLYLLHLVEAFGLEIRVSDRQNLIDQKDVRVHIDGDRKGQPHVHAGGIGADRIVDIVLQLGKFDDVFQPAVNLLAG